MAQSNSSSRAYDTAIALRHDFPEAHCNRGMLLRQMERFAEALEAAERGLELGKERRAQLLPSDEWVEECRALAAAERGRGGGGDHFGEGSD